MVPFIRKVCGPNNTIQVQIMEKGRDRKNRVIKHVGTAHNQAELALLMGRAHELLHPGQQMLDLGCGVGRVHCRGRASLRRASLLWDVLRGAYRHLGFDVLGDEGFEQMVLARLIEPASKAATVGILEEIGVSACHENTFYNSLKRCAQRNYRDELSRLLFCHAIKGGDVTLLLYDVTTLYFEAEKEDEPGDGNDGLRRVGYSKERRVDPQIVVGLLVDRCGFPLEVSCWEGNKAETATLLPTIQAFQDRHQLADFVIVADAGMLSATNLQALDQAGMKFIVGARQTKAPYDLASHFHHNATAFKDGEIIDTITTRHANTKRVNNPHHKAEPIWNPDSAQGKKTWRVLWQYTTKRASHDQRTLTKQYNRAIDIVEGRRKHKKARFVTTYAKDAVFDHTSYNRATLLVGLKGYITNIPATLMPANEIIASYHDLWHVEQSFRMSKTDLKARPIFHHTKDAIQAHLTVVIAALAIARYLQNTSGISIKRLIRALKNIQETTGEINGHQITLQDPIPQKLQPTLEKLAHLLPHTQQKWVT